jgi:hypothetical protein
MQDDFLEELNIKTYNGFKDYLFYDVLQALNKVYMINNTSKTEEPAANKEEVREKVKLRLELEFETIDNERQDVMDVEELK